MTGAINQIFNPSLYKKFKLKFIELRQDPYFVPCGSKASMIRKADALQQTLKSEILASQSPDLTYTMVTVPMADVSPRDRLKTKGVLGIMAYEFIISATV